MCQCCKTNNNNNNNKLAKMQSAILIKTSWKEPRIKIANTHKQASFDDFSSLLYCPG